jgi:hypothetical protein
MMMYFSVECEAPGGGYGPNAVLVYDKNGKYIERVDYLDLMLDIWLGGELIQHVQCFCTTTRLWDFLRHSNLVGVAVRDMTVTLGEHLNDTHPNRVIPQFKELVLQRGLQGQRNNGWRIQKESVPNAEMFTGIGLPLFVAERVRALLVRYGVTGLEFEQARVY